MFAIWPPLTKMPSAALGKPSISAIHDSVWTSIAVDDGATRQSPLFWFKAAAMKSPSTDVGVGEPMM